MLYPPYPPKPLIVHVLKSGGYIYHNNNKLILQQIIYQSNPLHYLLPWYIYKLIYGHQVWLKSHLYPPVVSNIIIGLSQLTSVANKKKPAADIKKKNPPT